MGLQKKKENDKKQQNINKENTYQKANRYLENHPVTCTSQFNDDERGKV